MIFMQNLCLAHIRRNRQVSLRASDPTETPDAQSACRAFADPRLADGRWRDRHDAVQHGAAIGRMPGVCWNADHPDRITALYKGGGRCGLGHLPDEFLRRRPLAAEAAQRAGPRLRVEQARRRESGARWPTASRRRVIVAGSMGPTGEIMAPMGPLTHEAAVEMFHEQAEGLRDGGADVLWSRRSARPRNMPPRPRPARWPAWTGAAR